MKKTLISIMVICALAALIWLAIFFWKNLRGIGSAIRTPSQDIARILEKKQAQANASGMPLTLPEGFSISLFAKGLGKPRVMAIDPTGVLLVSIPSEGRIVALPDSEKKGSAGRIVTVIDGLDRPHGLAFRCAPECKLYIAEEHQVAEYRYDRKNLKAVRQKIITEIPKGGFHVTRTLLFLPEPHDDELLISVGSSCNVCREQDPRRATVLMVSVRGGALQTYASGLRNAVFMTLHPKTKKVWASEMGRDLLGDELPPDELNIVEQGRDYGWPLCFGKNVHDTDFDTERTNPCREPEKVPSRIDLPAHSAPLGLAFFPGEGWPEEFRNQLLVSFHGSWNRSIPTGYKIVRYRLDGTGALLGFEDFITGWLLPDGTVLGRPVDILIRPDGTIFVSDDKAGVIYRISRTGAEQARQ
jgi:glucose/arabinose dehydrogenase